MQNETIMKDMKFSSERGEGKGFPRSGKWEKERISPTIKEGARRRKYMRKGVGLKRKGGRMKKRRNNKRGKKGVPAKVANPGPERIRVYSAFLDPDTVVKIDL